MKRIKVGTGLVLFAMVVAAATFVDRPSARASAQMAAEAAAGSTIGPHRATQARTVENYGKLPLSFEANEGQTNPRVKFLARGRGYTLFLTGSEAVLSLRKASATELSRRPSPTTTDSYSEHRTSSRPSSLTIPCRVPRRRLPPRCMRTSAFSTRMACRSSSTYPGAGNTPRGRRATSILHRPLALALESGVPLTLRSSTLGLASLPSRTGAIEHEIGSMTRLAWERRSRRGSSVFDSEDHEWTRRSHCCSSTMIKPTCLR